MDFYVDAEQDKIVFPSRNNDVEYHVVDSGTNRFHICNPSGIIILDILFGLNEVLYVYEKTHVCIPLQEDLKEYFDRRRTL
jgi:hypothetical protein